MWNDVTPYLPYLITSSVTAVFGYLLGIRSDRHKRFMAQAENSLKSLCSPIYHEMRLIKNAQNSNDKMTLLGAFIEKYHCTDTLIHRFVDSFYIEQFHDLVEGYEAFNNDRSGENWAILWRRFLNIYNAIEPHFFSLHSAVYSKFRWYDYLSKRNRFFKLVLELFALIYEFLEFVTAALVFSLVVVGYGYLSGAPYASAELIRILLMALGTTLLFFSIAILEIDGRSA